MPPYYDEKWKRWRYRDKSIVWADGVKRGVSGSAPKSDNTERGAKNAERAHINRVTGVVESKAEAISQRAAGEPTKLAAGIAGEPTIAELAKLVTSEYRPDGKPRGTDSRELLIENSIVPFFGVYRPSQLDQGHVEAFVRACLKSGNSQRTINNKLSALSVVLKYAYQRRKISAIPVLALRRDEARSGNKVKPYSPDQIKDMLKVARRDQRYRVAILLGADAGMRIGEIRGLMWTDIVYKTDEIHIRRAIDVHNNTTGPNGKPLGTKNNGTRTIPFITPRLRDELDALPRRGLYVLTRLDDEVDKLRGIAKRRASPPGGFLGYQGMKHQIDRIMRDAGIPHRKEGGDKSPWHSLRHAFATELRRRGVPLETIQHLLDHADRRTTEGYISVSAEEHKATVRKALGLK